MSDQRLNKLGNLAQLFCDRADVSFNGSYTNITIRDSSVGADLSSSLAAMKFLCELARQGFIDNFVDASAQSDRFSLYGREINVATNVYARGGNGGYSAVVSLPSEIAVRIENEVSFDFDPNS